MRSGEYTIFLRERTSLSIFQSRIIPNGTAPGKITMKKFHDKVPRDSGIEYRIDSDGFTAFALFGRACPP